MGWSMRIMTVVYMTETHYFSTEAEAQEFIENSDRTLWGTDDKPYKNNDTGEWFVNRTRVLAEIE
jgi:hypothetical protein